MKNTASPVRAQRGFTLLETMIAVALIGILAAIAMPAYRDYVTRGQLVDATTGLNAVRADMERHFQDNRSYNTVGSFTSPCLQDASKLTYGNFAVSCDGTPTATAYTLQAVGSGPTSGYTFKLNQQNVQSTTAAPTGWGTCASKWVLKRGQGC